MDEEAVFGTGITYGISPLPVLIWTILGIIVGIILALTAFFLLRKAGAYHWDWRHARWFRALTLAVMLLAIPVLLGIAGLSQGFLIEADQVLNRLRSMKEIKDLGDAGADLLMTIDVVAPQVAFDGQTFVITPEMDAAIDKALVEFREGRQELNVPRLFERIKGAKEQAIRSCVNRAQVFLSTRYPAVTRMIPARILDWFLYGLMEDLLQKKVTAGLTQLGLMSFLKPVTEVVNGLPAAAARSADPATISHRELSEYLVSSMLDAWMIDPIRAVVRKIQILVGIAILAVLCLPPLCFRLAEHVRKKRSMRNSALPHHTDPSTKAGSSN